MKSAGQISATLLAFLVVTTAALNARQNKTPIKYDGFDLAPGYNVKFLNSSYTIDQHLQKIGRKFTTLEIPRMGYGANLTDDDVKAVYSDPEVDFIEYNCFGKLLKPIELPSLHRRAQDANAGYALTYLSEKAQNPTDNTYYYPDDAGNGVDIYIVDSGITTANTGGGTEFGTRIHTGVDYSGRSFQDDDNHGTSVAACAAGSRYGTSKKATIWNYKIMDPAVRGMPNVLFVESALQSIIQADAVRKTKGDYKGAVINLSLGLPDSPLLKDSIEEAVKAGITVVAAAGNSKADASQISPCKYSAVICVGSVDDKYAQASFSNWGKSLALYAPGSNVDSLDNTGKAVKRNGTSFSSPYVAGIAAIFYGVEGKGMNPGRVKDLLDQNAEKNILTGILGGGPNVLANNGKQKAPKDSPYIGAPPPPPPPPPPATTSTKPAPAPTPAKGDVCGTWYKFGADYFEIYGKGFDVGPYGRTLLDHLRHCGVVSNWTWDAIKNDPQGMEWKATGSLPIGTKSCIGSAVTDLGGASPDGCTGAG